MSCEFKKLCPYVEEENLKQRCRFINPSGRTFEKVSEECAHFLSQSVLNEPQLNSGDDGEDNGVLRNRSVDKTGVGTIYFIKPVEDEHPQEPVDAPFRVVKGKTSLES